VENAVKHGTSKLVGKGEIMVDVNKKGNDINIVVSDNGESFPDDLAPGFGIQSIYDKLEILYKNRFEMNFTNSPLKQVIVKLR
jgi:LytS/YehU family sensor histidine kinase